MSDSKLKINDDKPELIAIGTKSIINQATSNLTPMSVSGYDIPFSQSNRNLCIFVDKTLSMDVHIKSASFSLLMLPTKLLFLSYSQD